MRKIFSVFLIVIFIFSITACKRVNNNNDNSSNQSINSKDEYSSYTSITDVSSSANSSLQNANSSTKQQSEDSLIASSSLVQSTENNTSQQNNSSNDTTTTSITTGNEIAKDNNVDKPIENPEVIVPTFTNEELEITVNQLLQSYVYCKLAHGQTSIFTEDVPNLSMEESLNFIYGYLKETILKDYFYTNVSDYNGQLNIPLNKITETAKIVLGKDYDFTKLGNRTSNKDLIYYDSYNQSVIVNVPGYGGVYDNYEYLNYTVIANDTADVTFEYCPFDDIAGKPIKSGQTVTLTIKKHSEGLWQIISYKKIEL